MSAYGLHVHDLDPGRVTGIARYASGLAEAMGPLLRDGETATVITARSNGTTTAPHHSLSRKRRTLYSQWLLTGRPLLENLVPGLDLVHVTAPIVPIPTRLPVVATVHDLLPITNGEWYAIRDVVTFKLTMAWLKRRARMVLTPTEYVAGQVVHLLGFPPHQVIATGEGFDRARFAALPSGVGFGLAPQSYVLYLGALSLRKNLVALIKAFPRDGISLVLAGPNGHGADEVLAAAAQAGPHVRVLGRVEDSEIEPLLRGAVALAHPSSFEGFGLTVLEAMASGTPVIVSRAGALQEVVGEAGLVVESNDAAGWARALEVLTDPAELAGLREKGLARADLWTWESAAGRTLEAYRAVLCS